MIRTEKTGTRPSVEVQFYRPEPVAIEHIDRTYRTTGKLKSSRMVVSPNLLSVTMIEDWDTLESFREYMEDPVVVAMMEATAAYNAQNSIFTTSTSIANVAG